MNYMNPTDFLTSLKGFTGANDKIEYISILRKDKYILQMLRLALDPRIVFGITPRDCTPNFTEHDSGISSHASWVLFMDTLEKIADGTFTVAEGKCHIRKILFKQENKTRLWMLRVLDKNLRVGISVTSANKAIPGLIPTFDVALCKPYTEGGIDFPVGNWTVEPKYDGVRGICNTSDKKIYSRKGIELFNVGHIVDALYDVVGGGFVFDGELVDTDWNQTISTLHTEKVSGKCLVYHIFDVLTVYEFKTKISQPLVLRQKVLRRLFDGANFAHIRIVISSPIHTPNQLKLAHNLWIAQKFEGVVLKDLNAPYPFKRSKSWQKLKTFLSDDFVITSVKKGEGKYSGMLGAFEIEHNGCFTWVGSGLTETQRIAWFTYDVDFLIGKTVEVKYQSKTKDGALLFPTFLRLRVDK